MNFKTVNPTITDLMNLVVRQSLLNTNCHKIATVQSINKDQFTISCTINWKRSVGRKNKNGEIEIVAKDYPVLIDCPFLKLGNSDLGLNVPLRIGDQALICFSDQSIDNWFSGNSQMIPDSTRLHSFTDALAIVGLFPKTKAGSFYDENRVGVFNGNSFVGVSSGKALIKNSEYELGNLLSELISKIKDLVTQTSSITVTGVTGGPGTSGAPSNAGAISAISSQLDSVNQKLEGLLG